MISGKNASGWLIRACRHSSILARPSYRSRIGVDTSPSSRTRSEDMSTSKSGVNVVKMAHASRSALGAAYAPLGRIEVLLNGTLIIPTSSGDAQSQTSIQLLTRISLRSFQCEIFRFSGSSRCGMPRGGRGGVNIGSGASAIRRPRSTATGPLWRRQQVRFDELVAQGSERVGAGRQPLDERQQVQTRHLG